MDAYVDQMALQLIKMNKFQYHLHRANHVKSINGEIFFPVKTWPEKSRKMFYTTPLSDVKTFELLICLIGESNCFFIVIFKTNYQFFYCTVFSKKT